MESAALRRAALPAQVQVAWSPRCWRLAVSFAPESVPGLTIPGPMEIDSMGQMEMQ